MFNSIDHGVILLYHTYLYVCIILYQACWLDSTVNVNNYAQCKFPPCNKLLHLFKKTLYTCREVYTEQPLFVMKLATHALTWKRVTIEVHKNIHYYSECTYIQTLTYCQPTRLFINLLTLCRFAHYHSGTSIEYEVLSKAQLGLINHRCL